MDLVAIGFHLEELQPILKNVVEDFDIKNLITNYHNKYNAKRIELPEYTNPIFIDQEQIQVNGNYPINSNEMKPLDEKIIFEMAVYETIAIQMMERLKRISDFDPSYMNRKRIYLRHLQFWNHILCTYEIKFGLFYAVPHTIFDFVLYGLCKIKNIPTIVLSQAHVEDTIYFFNDFKNSSPRIKKTYEEYLHRYKDTPIDSIQLSDRFMNHFNKQIQVDELPTPFYMKKHYKKKSKLKSIWWVLTHIKFKELNLQWRKYKEFQDLSKYYKKLTTKPDLKEKYVYFGLHYQPEATTCPLAGAFVDQLLMIRILSKYLPDDVRIYVKEHPAQRELMRDQEFYQELSQIPKVDLIPKNFDSNTLNKHSMLVATATGTLAWEALFRNKPAIIFGSIEFQYAKGVFQIKTINDCKNAIEDIFHRKIFPTKKSTKIFLKALEDTTIEGYIDISYKVVSNIDEKKNIQNITYALKNEISDILQKNKNRNN